MELAFLSEYPELALPLARWHHAEWEHLMPDWTFEQCLRELQDQTGREAIPTTVVALDAQDPTGVQQPSEGRLLGSASLVREDLGTLPPFSPWLASVFVRPDLRGRGVGQALVARIEAVARTLGVTTLYLFTEDREGFYERLGWQKVAVSIHLGLPLVIMSKGVYKG